MSETKWTPGPWTVRESSFVRERLYVEGPSPYGSWLVAEVGGRSGENAANARLITAAPDLYAALVELLQFTSSGPCQLPMLDPCRCAACKNYRANAALAKARGEA